MPSEIANRESEIEGEARDFIKGKNGTALTAVLAADLADAPAAPEGVERWYLVEGVA